VLVVEDMQLVREGLGLLLDEVLGYRVIEAHTAEEGVAIARRQAVDVVLLDRHLPDDSSLWAVERIVAERSGLPVVMMSAPGASDGIEAAFSRGASGFILKDSTVSQLSDAVEAALAREGTRS
jgi:DNA-binding NarL/FixJ family response regulator